MMLLYTLVALLSSAQGQSAFAAGLTKLCGQTHYGCCANGMTTRRSKHDTCPELTPRYASTTTTAYDSSESSGSGESSASFMLSSGSSSDAVDTSSGSLLSSSSGSSDSSFFKSGSSGSYMSIWMWLLAICCCMGCIGGIIGGIIHAVMGKKKPKKGQGREQGGTLQQGQLQQMPVQGGQAYTSLAQTPSYTTQAPLYSPVMTQAAPVTYSPSYTTGAPVSTAQYPGAVYANGASFSAGANYATGVSYPNGPPVPAAMYNPQGY